MTDVLKSETEEEVMKKEKDGVDGCEEVTSEEAVKKKRNKKKKKKVGAGGGSKQTNPPSIPVDVLFPNKTYPLGLEQEYSDAYVKTVNMEEKRAQEMIHEDFYKDLRKAAEVHREVRYWAKHWIQPGMKMFDIAETVEEKLRVLISEDGLNAGLAFPTGCSLNECAAHYTPNKGDERILQKDDVMKLDMGVHVNGHIIDSALTLTWNDKYDKLLEASKDATLSAIKEAGVDCLLSHLGEMIEEIIKSYEVEIVPGKMSPIRPIANLSGHSLGHYIIHAGKSVPLVGGGERERMQEGECFAIETFASTGKGYVHDDVECSHYMRNPSAGRVPLRGPKPKALLRVIDQNFGTLAFARRHLDRLGEERYGFALKQLVDSGLVRDYPPLNDVKGSYVSQFEHTFVLKPTGKEVLSSGTDF